MSGTPLGTNPAASADLTAKYSKLFQLYRLAVNGAHFGPSATTIAGGPLWEWQDPSGSGIVACEGPPLLRALASPRLKSEADQCPQSDQPQQQQQKQQQQ